MRPVRCHCGRPLHYTNPRIQSHVEALVATLGPDIEVTALDRTWLVQRHYIALHGIKAADLPKLGFKEVDPLPNWKPR